jgi:hypothetical protein
MDLVLLVAALLISFLVFTWLIKVVKATLWTAVTIALLVLLAQLLFGIGPTQLFDQVAALWTSFWQFITGQ